MSTQIYAVIITCLFVAQTVLSLLSQRGSTHQRLHLVQVKTEETYQKMNQPTFEIRLTPKGKHYCVALIGENVVAVSRKAYTNGEEAMSDVLEQLAQPERKVAAIYAPGPHFMLREEQ